MGPFIMTLLWDVVFRNVLADRVERCGRHERRSESSCCNVEVPFRYQGSDAQILEQSTKKRELPSWMESVAELPVPSWKPDLLSPALGHLMNSLQAEPYSSAPCSSPELHHPSAIPGDSEQFRGVEGNKMVMRSQWQDAGDVAVLSPPPHLSTLLLLQKPAAFFL